ncbi:MAG: class I SAM-dependent methyltransferase [bacterium]
MTDSSASGRGWYRRAFQDDYLLVYSHRTLKEARHQVAMAIKHLPFKRGQQVLDIACGSGRHLLAFAERGAEVTGIDLSAPLLREAKELFRAGKYKATLKRADMRELPYQERFDGVSIWFTSFGYFTKESDDLKALKSLAAALRPGGWWWIDIPNPVYLRSHLIPESRRSVTGEHGKVMIFEQRRIVGDRVVKKVVIQDSKGKRSWDERVRLYSPEQFGSIIKRARLTTHGVLGDYDGGALAASRPRQIWYGLKP